jgi:transposase
VVVVIETDRGPWVKALAAAGYRVYAVNPKQAARHKETIAVSGKKDDFFDAGALADMGRTRRHQIRELAADSDIAEAVKIAARARQKLVWERTRHLLRMRSALREHFAAALEAYAGLTLTGPDALELLGRAPGPASAIKVMEAKVSELFRRHPDAGIYLSQPGNSTASRRLAAPAGTAKRHCRGASA